MHLAHLHGEIDVRLLTDPKNYILRFFRPKTRHFSFHSISGGMQSVEGVRPAVVCGGRVGNARSRICNSDLGAGNDGTARIMHNATDLGLKAGLPQNECRDQTQQYRELHQFLCVW